MRSTDSSQMLVPVHPVPCVPHAGTLAVPPGVLLVLEGTGGVSAVGQDGNLTSGSSSWLLGGAQGHEGDGTAGRMGDSTAPAIRLSPGVWPPKGESVFDVHMEQCAA